MAATRKSSCINAVVNKVVPVVYIKSLQNYLTIKQIVRLEENVLYEIWSENV